MSRSRAAADSVPKAATRAEKAAYIQAVYDGLLKLMPNLHHESYIHVDDVRAGAYGYGGKTQEYRAHNP